MKSIENLKKKRDRVNERCVEYLEKNGAVPREVLDTADIQNSLYEK